MQRILGVASALVLGTLAVTVEAAKNRTAHMADTINYALRQTLPSTGDDALGYALAFAQDGKVVAAGARDADNENGYAHVYKVNKTGQYSMVGGALRGPNIPALDGAFFGSALDITEDAKTLVVGAPYADPSGAAFVFAYSLASKAYTETQRLDSPTPNIFSEFGDAVAVSKDGRTIFVGAPESQNQGTGAVHIYRQRAKTWTLVQTVVPLVPGSALNYSFGSVLAASDDGKRFAVGGNKAGSSNFEGAVAVFKYDARSKQYTQVAAFANNDPVWYAFSLSLSGDGKTLAVGAPYADRVSQFVHGGKVFLYRLNKQGQYAAATAPAAPEANGEYGSGVALTRDGKTLVVGARDSNKAYVYKYDLRTQAYVLVDTLAAPAGISGMSNAVAVSKSGKAVAHGATVTAANLDAVLVYGRTK